MINGKIVDNKILLHTAQWYITHTCNISCSNCLSYNNFAIRGHDKFSDNLEAAKAWSQLVKIKDFTIVGGETFTHNKLNDWVFGLRDIFSDIKDFKVITNGTLLKKYEANFTDWFDRDVIIEISFKNSADYVVLQKHLTNYSNVEIKTHFMYDQAIYIDDKLRFLIEFCDNHRPWAVKSKENDVYMFWENDSKESHKKCWQKYCHYFFRGKLYKCGTVVGAQEFVKNYPVEERCKDLYLDYKPISHTDNDLHAKILQLNNEIPQCSMCPIAAVPEQIILDRKKIIL